MNNKTFEIRDVRDSDATHIVGIFNYFALNSFAAYCEMELGPELFAKFKGSARVFKVLEINGKVIGFGVIQPFREFPNFNHTGMLTYFILPEYTGKGLGTRTMNTLIEEGKTKGITNFIAHISSENQQSLQFHRKHGFTQCGALKKVGTKFNRPFDVVWVQKMV